MRGGGGGGEGGAEMINDCHTAGEVRREKRNEGTAKCLEGRRWGWGGGVGAGGG